MAESGWHPDDLPAPRPLVGPDGKATLYYHVSFTIPSVMALASFLGPHLQYLFIKP